VNQLTLIQYWISVCVKLHEPLIVCDKKDKPTGELIHGYFRSLGVTAESELEVREFIRETVSEGEIDWSDTSIEACDYTDTDLELENLDGDPNIKGIWYKSGRIFFPDDEAEDRTPS
jgi:hypothetical protein